MGISVIMPTFNQEFHISRAIASLKQQTYKEWELIIINDGCTDNTKVVINDYLTDKRIRYYENTKNEGLGFSLNEGIKHSSYNLIAYLPSDDVYFSNHLQLLVDKLNSNSNAILAYSGLKYNHTLSTNKDTIQLTKGKAFGYSIQLVQVLHRKSELSWIDRDQMVTEDLFKMYWIKLLGLGIFIQTREITCEWIFHPFQRHKIIGGKFGGRINKYRGYYNVSTPINYCSNGSDFIDENKLYKAFRGTNGIVKKGLRILLVGELSWNPERIYALEEAGHELFGLWAENTIYSMVGPIPFGNVKNIPYSNWKNEIKKIKPDIIYALLNFMSVPLAYEVLKSETGIPFVWHFKEGPFFCRQNGIWNELCYLFTKSNGQIYSSQLMKDWFLQFIPDKDRLSLVIDGDLPKKDWAKSNQSPLLSEKDGEIHTVVPGRPYGLEPRNIEALAKQKIHFHFYGVTFQSMWKKWVEESMHLANGYFHLHPNCTQENWVREFSQYDAGWLHSFKSQNNGDLLGVNWDDMNIPSRMATLAVAGLPLLQYANTSHLVATKCLCEDLDIGLFFNDFNGINDCFKDKVRLRQIRNNVWQHRMKFTFDYHVPKLIDFFNTVINRSR